MQHILSDGGPFTLLPVNSNSQLFLVFFGGSTPYKRMRRRYSSSQWILIAFSSLKLDALSTPYSEWSAVLAFVSALNWILVLYKWSWPQSTWQWLQRPVYWNAACLQTAHAIADGKEAETKYTVGHTIYTWLTEDQCKDVLFFWQWRQVFFGELIVYFLYITPAYKYMLS